MYQDGTIIKQKTMQKERPTKSGSFLIVKWQNIDKIIIHMKTCLQCMSLIDEISQITVLLCKSRLQKERKSDSMQIISL